MCGRFYIDPDDMTDEELLRLLNREKDRAEQQDTPLVLGEVRPSNCAAVIALNRSSQRSAFKMQWGYHMDGRLLINARSETAAQKPTFQQGLKMRRCLIPASAYFEWDHREKPSQKYRFYHSEQRLIYLAGLYRFEENAPLPVFTILTRAAAPDIACFHDRMPVMIPGAYCNAWLDRANDATALLDHAFTEVAWDKAE